MPEYNTVVYEAEKELGIRNNNGSLKLKRLKKKHLDYIAMHLQGVTNREIAETVGVGEITISRVLNDPLAQAIINRSLGDKEMELNALMGQAVDTVRDSMEEKTNTMGTRLKGVDRFMKMKEMVSGGKGGQETAEDLIARMLQVNLNIQVNSGGGS